MSTVVESHVAHSDIKQFALDRVNLAHEDVVEQREQVNRLRERLLRKIAADPNYGLVKALNSGSVAKGTALAVGGDLDLAVYVRPGSEPTNDADLPRWLLDRLLEANPNMADEQFGLQEHAVSVTFKGTGLKVDVVAVLAASDGTDDGYLVLKESGQQVLTNIPRHLEFIRSRKKSCPVHFRQLIRLVKWWIRLQKVADQRFRFKSFMAELICSHLLDGGTDMSDYPAALSAFFDYIVRTGVRERIFFTDYHPASALPPVSGCAIEMLDPVNPLNNVAVRYTETQRQLMVSAAATALDALDEAFYAATKEQAVVAWQAVLGASFRP